MLGSSNSRSESRRNRLCRLKKESKREPERSERDENDDRESAVVVSELSARPIRAMDHDSLLSLSRLSNVALNRRQKKMGEALESCCDSLSEDPLEDTSE